MTPEAKAVLAAFEKASGLTFADADAPGSGELLAMLDVIGRQGPPDGYTPVALRSRDEQQKLRQATEAMLAQLNNEAPGILARFAEVRDRMIREGRP